MAAVNQKIKAVEISPVYAAELLGKSKYHAQRKVMRDVVNRYALQMEKGTWGHSESAIVIGIRDGVPQLLNGQQRLTAVVQSGKTIKFTLDTRQYGSDSEMDVDYGRMDRGSNRTLGQGLVAMGTAGTIGVGGNIVGAASAALMVVASRFGQVSRTSPLGLQLTSTSARHELLLAWAPEIKAYDNCISLGARRPQAWFLRRGVMAVGLITLRYSLACAEVFWSAVALNDKLPRDSAEGALFNLLATVNPAEKPDEWYPRAVAACWNAAHDGRLLKIVRAFPEAAITIKGTPFNGKVIDPTSILFKGMKSEDKDDDSTDE